MKTELGKQFTGIIMKFLRIKVKYFYFARSAQLSVLTAAFGRLFVSWNILGVRKFESIIGGEYQIKSKFVIHGVEPRREEQVLPDSRTGVEFSHTFSDRYYIQILRSIWDIKTGMAFTEDGKIGISDTSSRTQSLLSSTRLPVSRLNPTREGQFLIMPSNGYYHWLIEDLPNFLLSLNKYPESTVLVWESAPPYVLDFLELKGITYKFAQRFEKISQVNFLTKGSDSGWISQQDLIKLRQSFVPYLVPASATGKIYISRVNSSRSPKWELTLMELLKNEGWEVVEFEKMNLIEQFQKIYQAKVVCGVHGANLSNIVFSTPNSKVIELGGASFRRCILSLADACALIYSRIEFNYNDTRADSIVAQEVFTQIQDISNSGN